MVTNVHVELLTETSVKVSWNQIIANEIINYMIYYRPSDSSENKSSVTVSSSESFVVIDDLMTAMEYQFEVAATAELGGVVYPGDRSSPIRQLLVLSTPSHTTLLCKL